MHLDPYSYGEFDEEIALAYLLKESILFCNSRDYLCNGQKSGHTVVLFVLANDLFAPASDAEDISYSEIKSLYDSHRADPYWGVTKWLARKRNCKPWSRRVQQMKADGAWEEWMDQLEDNTI